MQTFLTKPKKAQDAKMVIGGLGEGKPSSRRGGGGASSSSTKKGPLGESVGDRLEVSGESILLVKEVAERIAQDRCGKAKAFRSMNQNCRCCVRSSREKEKERKPGSDTVWRSSQALPRQLAPRGVRRNMCVLKHQYIFHSTSFHPHISAEKGCVWCSREGMNGEF